MRLVCPNCDAKYEVPEDAIPDAGRDVQCANCSHAWFQTRERTLPPVVTKQPEPKPEPVASPPAPPMPAEIAASEAPAPAVTAAEPEAPAERAAPTGKSKAESSAKAASKASARLAETSVPVKAPDAADPTPEANSSAPEPEPEPELATSEPEPQSASVNQQPKPDTSEVGPEMAEDADPAPPIAAREVDESVLTILREEAEREAKARRSDGQTGQGQPDLGADTATTARKKGAGKKSTPEAAKPPARRDLLPDVEEINSTLRPSDLSEAEFVGDPDMAGREGRGAFRSGFLLVLSMAILGGAVYIASAWLANLIPALEGPLKSYVGLVDGVRLNMDSLMQSATQLISGEPG